MVDCTVLSAAATFCSTTTPPSRPAIRSTTLIPSNLKIGGILWRLDNLSNMTVVPHLMTLADLSGPQIRRVVSHAHYLKQLSTPWLAPQLGSGKQPHLRIPSQSLLNKSIALLFSKRSTRTRLAAETAALLLGGRALFLGKDDIQLGVNESPRDTARVIGGMCQGIFARVGDHSEIEVRETSKDSQFPLTFRYLVMSYPGARKVLTRTSPECIVFSLASYTSSRRPSHTSRACTPL
jgi:Aspartate/ornithine carbamoyltransferase, carbamoyl-P binding domain